MSDFRIFEYEVNTAKLPAGAEGPVFCMAADLHNQSYGPDNARLAEAILALEPDAVLAAGDLLIGRPGETFLPALSSVSSSGRFPPLLFIPPYSSCRSMSPRSNLLTDTS